MPPFRLHLKSQSGFSLLELTATVVISFVILGVSLSLITTQRRQYLNQQANTDTNQTLQSAMDFMGTDIRQAGEKIGPGLNLPVIRLFDGAVGAPDELLVQRKLLDTALNVCRNVGIGNTTIKVSDKTSPAAAGSSCTFSDDATLPKVPNGISDDVDSWHNFRCKVDTGKADCVNPTSLGSCNQNGGNNDECSWAYIYDPTDGKNEFFIYYGENTTDEIQVSALTQSYPAANKPQLYILEQRKYSLLAANATGDRTLNLETVDRDSNTAYQIVNRLRDFQVRGLIANAWVTTGFNVAPVAPAPPYADWQTVQSVEVTLRSLNSGPDANPTIQILTSQFFPRNSLSRP